MTGKDATHGEEAGNSKLTCIVNDNSLSSSSQESAETENRVEERCLSENVKKTVIGCVIVILLAVSWVGAQQFAQAAVRLHTFDAPFFATWFSTCWMILCFPVYCVFVALAERNWSSFVLLMKSSKNIFGQHPVTTREFFIIVLLNLLWLVVNFFYIYGLKFIAASVASAIMVSNVAFVYILSLFLLNENVYVIRITATVLCMGGVVLFGYAEGFDGSTVTVGGVVMIICSAIGAAVYKVVFKKLIGEGTLGQVSLFLTLLGISNLLIMWTICICICVAGVESLQAGQIPWEPLIYSAILGVIFNFLVNFGIAYTYPLFISISMMVGIPMNVGVDTVIHGEILTLIQVFATLLVFAGFTLTLLPDTWNNPIHRVMHCKIVSPSNQDSTPEQGELLQSDE